MQIEYYLWLGDIEGCGAAGACRLIEHFGSAENVYRLKRAEELSGIEGLRRDTAAAICSRKDMEKAKAEADRISSAGIKYVTYEDNLYPFLLKQIASPPPVLYYLGENLFQEHLSCLAVVGTRRSTPYGQSVAYSLAGQAARAGICIVSGLAAGIDYCAHRAALEYGGKTIAVTGCGLNRVYPGVHKDLYEDIIAEKSMLISEFRPDMPPLSGNFPRRNRIISGLSKGTLVVEAGVKSGSLITAAYATEQNRDVYAVPGNITEAMSAGTNKLISDGAKPVLSIKDILEEYNINGYTADADSAEAAAADGAAELSSDEKKLIGAVKSGIQTPDALSRQLQIETAKISSMITMLELKQQLTYKMGKLYATYQRR